MLVDVNGKWWMQSGLYRSLSGLDFVSLVASGGLLSLVSAFVLGGVRSRGFGFGLLGAFNAASLRLLVLVPVLVAALVRASDAGSLRLEEIARDQGTLPQKWALFDSPFSFVLGVAYLLALVPLSGRRAPIEGHPGTSSKTVVFARVSEWTGALLLLGLWVVLYAGAPGGHSEHHLATGVLLSVKLAILAHSLAWVRARTGHLRLSESWGLFTWANLLVSIAAAAAQLGILVLGFKERHTEILSLFSVTLCLSFFLLSFVTSQRSWAHMGRKSDPWI